MSDKTDIKIIKDIILSGLLEDYRMKTRESPLYRKLYCLTLAMTEDGCGACIVFDKHGRLTAETVIAKEYTVNPHRLVRVIKEFWLDNPSYGFTVAIPHSVSELYHSEFIDEFTFLFEFIGVKEQNYIIVKGASFEDISLGDVRTFYK